MRWFDGGGGTAERYEGNRRLGLLLAILALAGVRRGS